VAPIITPPNLQRNAEHSNDDVDFLSDTATTTLEDVEKLKIQSDLESLLSSLPRNLHWDKQKKKLERQRQQKDNNASTAADRQSSRLSSSLGILEEDEDEEDDDIESPNAATTTTTTTTKNATEDDDDEGLEIAWQYKKSVQQERLGTSGTTTGAAISTNALFCHSYDLSGRMVDQEEGATKIEPKSWIEKLTLPSSSSSSSSSKNSSLPTKGLILFRDLANLLQNKMSADGGKAIRLLLYHPDLEAMAIALPLLLTHIREQSMPIVVMICTSPTADVTSWIRLARNCDMVLSTEGFASRREYPPPPEFRHLHGVLKITKTVRKPTEIAALIYGFKRDRRKLHVQLLHIPPEDYADNGGSVGAGGVRSGAGRPSKASESNNQPTRKAGTGAGWGCSSNLSTSMLDF
jgi:hypothetical protein